MKYGVLNERQSSFLFAFQKKKYKEKKKQLTIARH